MEPIVQHLRLACAIFACCINTSFYSGYNAMSLYSIIYVVADWTKKPILKPSYEELKNSTSMITFSYCNMVEVAFSVGAVFGSSVVFHYSNKFGRKGGMLMSNIICIFGILFCGYCKLFDMPLFLVIGRLLLGVKCGLCSCLGPMYLCDIVPRSYRGKVGAIYSAFYAIGEITGFIVSKLLATKHVWPLVFSLNIITIMIQLIILPVCPESPKYTFVVKNKELECRKAVIWLRGYNLNEEEYNEFIYELLQQKRLGGMSLKVLAEHFILMRALLICSVLLLSQPLCGIKIIIRFAAQSSLALKTESGEPDFVKLTAFLVVLVIVTVVNIFVIDSIPRQKLLFATFLMMSVCCAMNCTLVNFVVDMNSFIVIMIIFLHLLCFKVGCGCISLFIVSEYFNTLAAPLAFSIAMTISWSLIVCEYLFANRLEVFLEGYLFLNYAITNGALAYFCYVYVIDTRDISLKILYKIIYNQLRNGKPMFSKKVYLD